MGLDTESDSFYHYFEKVCLLQLGDGNGAVGLVDPLALPDLSFLGPLMADPGVVKILHGGENDVALLKRDFGFAFASLFDTQLAARFLGRPALGLQALLESELGVRHFKDHQRCDWSRRPLTPPQEQYAVEDVLHLPELRARLEEDLRRRGRLPWALEESDALARIPPAPRREPPDFLRAKGARDLSPRELAVLRELFELRDAWARRADLPPFKVVGDEALVALAVRRPRDPRGLERIKGLPARVRERRAHEVLAAVRRGEAVPDSRLPRRERAPRLRRPTEVLDRIERLKAWRAEAAPRAELDPGFLLPQRLIELVAEEPPADVEALAEVPGFRRWRAEAFGAAILRTLGR